MILFAHRSIHQQWCEGNHTMTTTVPVSGFFGELCMQYILPTLIITYE